jgi:hypothetical protein
MVSLSRLVTYLGDIIWRNKPTVFQHPLDVTAPADFWRCRNMHKVYFVAHLAQALHGLADGFFILPDLGKDNIGTISK